MPKVITVLLNSESVTVDDTYYQILIRIQAVIIISLLSSLELIIRMFAVTTAQAIPALVPASSSLALLMRMRGHWSGDHEAIQE